MGKSPRRLFLQPRSLPPRRAEKEVRLVFADTLYWGAILHPLDQYRAQVIQVREALGHIRLVTTDEVLNAYGGSGGYPPHKLDTRYRSPMAARSASRYNQAHLSRRAGTRAKRSRL